MRYLKKISFKQFKKDILDDKKLYNLYKIPERSTIASAGYDFFSLKNLILKPGEIKKIPTGIKANMNEDEVLLLIVRSSMGFKYNVRMCNQVGVIDKDYYDNVDNEGHIFLALENQGTKDYEIKINDKICQGIFVKYLKADDEEKINNKRIGGIGSTNNKGEIHEKR